MPIRARREITMQFSACKFIIIYLHMSVSARVCTAYVSHKTVPLENNKVNKNNYNQFEI